MNNRKCLDLLNEELMKINRNDVLANDGQEFYQARGKKGEYYCPVRIASWVEVGRSEIEKNKDERKLAGLLKRRLRSAYRELMDFCEERMKCLEGVNNDKNYQRAAT